VHAWPRRGEEHRADHPGDVSRPKKWSTASCCRPAVARHPRTIGTFSYWASDLTSWEEGNTEMGGYLKTLLFDNGVAETFLLGPENPI